MDQRKTQPKSTREVLDLLKAAHAELGKGSRRVAQFVIENPGVSALLSSSEVAHRCGVHASSVVRLAQGLGFEGYREFQSILQEHFSTATTDSRRMNIGDAPPIDTARPMRIHLFADSGKSFNGAAEAAAQQYASDNPLVRITTQSWASYEVSPEEFGRAVEAAIPDSDGIIVVGREHPAVNDAVRLVIAKGVPVICLTTDLPASGRTAYVGSDQYASGATAGWFCGKTLPKGEPGRVLFVCSVPFRCHQDREQGFRHVLRSEFPSLAIDEKVSSDESFEVIYEAVRRYIGKSGPPAAIYNVSGANLGVGKALEDEGLNDKVIFVGHELNKNSRSLLERGIMDLTIGHDFDREISLAVDCIKMAHQGVQPVNRFTQSQLFTRFNCAIF